MVLAAVLLSLTTLAQQNTGVCGTGEPSAANLEFLERLHQNGYFEARIENETIFIPMKIHIIRNSQGVASFQFSDALRNMCELNDWYRPFSIQFFLRGAVNYIDNSDWANSFERGDENTINPIHNVANVVNVYYVNMQAIGLCGFGNFPGTGSPSSTTRQGAIYLSPGCSGVGNTTFPHEMGHHMNLLHPFQGTSDAPASPTAERVTRNNNEASPRVSANCTSAGDRFCDTPADYLSDRWNCPRSHTQVDLNGDIFNPDATLIMSYANDNCVTRFSDQQVAAMRATVTIVNGISGPRRYWLVPPMEPYDTITTKPTPLEPAASATGIPNNWAYFKWTSVPGATMYILRLRFNFTTLEEILVSDTSYLYTGAKLNGGANYRWSVTALNHKITCIDWTADRIFTTVANGVSVEALDKLKFKVYPTALNSGDQLHFEFQEELTGEIAIQIQDLSGRVVQQQKTNLQNGGRFDMAVEATASGIYFVRVSQNGLSQFEKIILNR